jgi:ketosteroid isomerase-like protein
LRSKSPNIVFAGADLDQAVEGSHLALFFNQGQVCCAGPRLYVEAKCHDEFVARSVERARRRKVGDPFEESGDLAYGPGAYELTLSPPGSGAISDKGKYVVVYRRHPEGSWKAVADIFNSSQPAV